MQDNVGNFFFLLLKLSAEIFWELGSRQNKLTWRWIFVVRNDVLLEKNYANGIVMSGFVCVITAEYKTQPHRRRLTWREELFRRRHDVHVEAFDLIFYWDKIYNMQFYYLINEVEYIVFGHCLIKEYVLLHSQQKARQKVFRILSNSIKIWKKSTIWKVVRRLI